MDPGRRVSGQGFCSHAHLGPEAQPLWDPPQGSGAGGGQTKSNRDKTETERSDHRGRPGGGRQQMRRGREKSAGRMCAGQRGRLCRRHRGRGRLGRAPLPRGKRVGAERPGQPPAETLAPHPQEQQEGGRAEGHALQEGDRREGRGKEGCWGGKEAPGDGGVGCPGGWR